MDISAPKRLRMLIFCFFSVFVAVVSALKCVSESTGTPSNCHRGTCIDGRCICEQGWVGEFCNECGGRMQLTEDSGYLTDGPTDYGKSRECSWVIQPINNRNITIRLQLLEFATECGWDYMYVYDGDSASAPLLATFNGLMSISAKDKVVSEVYLPEVVATSGTVFVHFFSDVEYVMKGFNISYSVRSCPQNCSGNGICIVSSSGILCECSSGWMGEACELLSCPRNCSEEEKQGVCADSVNFMGDSMCQCENGYQSLDCTASIPAEEGFWRAPLPGFNHRNIARASHSGVIIADSLWLYGGIQFGELSSNGGFDVYNISSNCWHRVMTSSDAIPTWRYGHSMVFTNNTIVVFGGRNVLTSQTLDDVWEYNIVTKSWKNILYTKAFQSTEIKMTFSPLALWGHTGTLVKFANGADVMVVMFGFHAELEYSGSIFEYDLKQKIWLKAVTSGASIEAAFGHTTTYDPLNRLCYVHGGFSYLKPDPVRSYGLTDVMYSYDPELRSFKVLRASGSPRFLHSAVLINGSILVYGGCTLNDSKENIGALCFSPAFMAYHPSCDKWEDLSSLDIRHKGGRYGHVAFALNGRDNNTPPMLLHGGYDGTIIESILLYQPASCSLYSGSKSLCIGSHHNGLSCAWSGTECVANESIPSYDTGNVSCGSLSNSPTSYCTSLKTCVSCSNTADDCVWNGTQCFATNYEQTSPAACHIDDDVWNFCQRFRNCMQCEFNSQCHWSNSSCSNKSSNKTASCENSCGMHSSCNSCTAKSCMWCTNRRLCVSTTSYVTQFPYGECMKWINKEDQCAAAEGCSALKTCGSCLLDPFCGWCDDGSETGLGYCQSGSLSGSKTSVYHQNVISYTRLVERNSTSQRCAKGSWYFTSCPLCQCNGHSKCFTGTSDCIACEDFTTGDQCERCTDGYFGEATNGGQCQNCECFGRAIQCDHTNGACFCSTKGQIGEICESCDNDAKYYGNPEKNSTCFYRLLINYSFTFTLTLTHDEYVTAINFENTPLQEGSIELNFESSEPCNIRLTVFSYTPIRRGRLKRSANHNTESVEYEGTEVEVLEKFSIDKFVFEYADSRYGFGNAATNATIRVYVSNFTVPTRIQVSVVQRNTSLLTLLLILFSCFLVLLLLTALGWKLKMLYDNCQQRRYRSEQLEQMAARPFATVYLTLDCINPRYASREECLDSLSEEFSADGLTCAFSVALRMPSSGDNVQTPAIINTDRVRELYPSGALAVGTALVERYKSRTTETDQRQNSSTTNAEKPKIIFKRGKDLRASGRTSNSQTSSATPRPSDHNDNPNRPDCNRAEARTTQRRRRYSKHGRASFSSLRSRSISPSNDTGETRERCEGSQLPTCAR